MRRKRFSENQVVSILEEFEAGKGVEEAAKLSGFTTRHLRKLTTNGGDKRMNNLIKQTEEKVKDSAGLF
jgi:hypothetical protein